ncbi:hypothetical protein POVWA2_018950 [Plasmodium ovale wallikeri]|uniref:Uncharacterized protein n=1 Tax=Plasmodium ovale wallikeri TaxID=864142 RepID=A0A1A8YRI4_PLAOA|nr:hypothetical protein POVWA2_018950 [Plasmodium ovale wallikeri]
MRMRECIHECKHTPEDNWLNVNFKIKNSEKGKKYNRGKCDSAAAQQGREKCGKVSFFQLFPLCRRYKKKKKKKNSHLN